MKGGEILYIYKSPVGIIKIIKSNNRYNLVIDKTVYGSYNSAVAAADDVYTQTTGYYEFDILDCSEVDIPTDIYEWEKI